ncbi:MAG: tyrosine-type recombinase/integrase [Deltaproteobacteria bacterium]|nr:tyrosine-type recombinase/integrase [Deltaproteobacteria bacterium]
MNKKPKQAIEGAKQALIPVDNLKHNVPGHLSRARTSLRALAQLYFQAEVAGQARGTIEAKRRDLSRFLAFYEALYHHDHPDEWYASVTREFLKQLRKSRPAQATVVRTYASVRHFARWVHHKVKPFPLGCPTDGVKPPEEPEPEWKGLSRADELRLLNAAQTLRVRPGRGTNQGTRDHVAIAVLLGSGLRVSEMLNLNREQYTGRGFTNVLIKGGRIRDFVPVQAQAREVLEEWLTVRGDGKGPLFTTRSGERLSRVQLFLILQRVAAQANAHLPSGEKVKVSPHVLRHTFLRKLAEEKGVQYAKEASGHKSDRYIWRYVKPSQQSLAAAIDELE